MTPIIASFVSDALLSLRISEPDRANLEAWSYVVTIVALPLAVLSFVVDNRKQRQNDEEEIYQQLSEQYIKFLGLVTQNADLGLLTTATNSPALTPEQYERKVALYNILIAVLEEGYILAFEDHMNRAQKRRWQSWHDFIVEWCRKEDFRATLPSLLQGEDPDFVNYVVKLCADLKTPITLANH